MSLEKYQQKRNFDITPEPSGLKENSHQSRFTIQRHDARRLHYDLRLEMKGVLKSWAIPKGPSMNPEDKRLAIDTEDHPIKYLHFEGTIPKGNYGAGKMTIWDRGTYTSYKDPDNAEKLFKEYQNGTLHLMFKGQKVKGKFTLVRTNFDRKDHWLLIKQSDEYSTGAPYDAEDFKTFDEGADKMEGKIEEGDVEVDDRVERKGEIKNKEHFSLDKMISPMLATSAQEPFDNPEWLYELKYDGYRVIANLWNNQVNIYSRNGISYNEKFKEVYEELMSMAHEAILDGEMIVVDQDGKPVFQALQNYDNSTKGKLQYFVFDLLYLNGHSLMELPLKDRKELLRDLLPDGNFVQFCDHIEEEGRSFYTEVLKQDMEGIIAKRKDSTYHPGKRSDDWLKIKKVQTADPIICGYTKSDKSDRTFGSLILGMEKEGRLYYAGNCGTGFSYDVMNELYGVFQPLKKSESPFVSKINLKGRIPQWLSPELICEIKYSEITRDGLFRHPVFIRMRPDKKGTVVERKVESHNTTNQDDLEINNVNISFTHIDKIYWPESGLRKYDLIDYYIEVSDVILPYLVDRPQNLHRHPEGIDKPGFYQKDQEHLPEWVATAELYSKSSDKNINYLLCQNEATLLYMVNLGCIEINPWLSRVENLDFPDYAVIDLDPSPSNHFDQVIETALVFKEILDKIGVPGLTKTSGSSGIHIYLPLAAKYSYEQARDFVRLLCIMAQKTLPELTTMERSLKKRDPKIYLDYLQNRHGQTLASPYSVRPVPGACVSAPVSWHELEDGIQLQGFNLHSMPSRIKKKGDLFSGLLKTGINMTEAINRLEISIR